MVERSEDERHCLRYTMEVAGSNKVGHLASIQLGKTTYM